jgi:hypothetical protein
VSIRGQKIRKNIKTNETIRKEKILCFQLLILQSLDIKQVRKTAGQDSLLPSCSDFVSSSRQLVAIVVILYDTSVTWDKSTFPFN